MAFASSYLKPSSISILTPVGVKAQMLKLSNSPFYQNEKLITNLVRNMVNQGNEQAVFHLLKNIIEIEKNLEDENVHPSFWLRSLQNGNVVGSFLSLEENLRLQSSKGSNSRDIKENLEESCSQE